MESPWSTSPLHKRVAWAASESHPVWREISQYFKPEEFNNPFAMDVEFLRLLFVIREKAGVPMRLTSDARDPDGDVGADKSAHKKRPCRAVDVWVKDREERARIVISAIHQGITRLGIYPEENEAGAGVIHIDAETHKDNPSPRIWALGLENPPGS